MDKREASKSRPWLAVGQEIAELLDRIDGEAFAGLQEAFQDNKRCWFFTGQGRSGLVAQMAAMRFMHLGRLVHVVGEATAPSIRFGDGLLVISGSGETPVSVSHAQIAKAEKAKVVTLTHKPQAAIARLADIVMPIPVASSQQFGGSLFEQTCLVILDAVVLAIASAIPDAKATMSYRHTNLQ